MEVTRGWLPLRAGWPGLNGSVWRRRRGTPYSIRNMVTTKRNAKAVGNLALTGRTGVTVGLHAQIQLHKMTKQKENCINYSGLTRLLGVLETTLCDRIHVC